MYTYTCDIIRLIIPGESSHVVAYPLSADSISTSSKCDGCPYNALCFIDTAERHNLPVLPLLRAMDKPALQRERLIHVRQLATLLA
jgi:hypothetical protein